MQCQLTIPKDECSSYDAISFGQQALQQRGWALQEHVLARRVLHYNSRQIYFECNEGILAEDGCHFLSRLCDLSLGDGAGESAASIRLKNFRLWNDLLVQSGRRKLTKPTDKLPAMSNLAKIIGSRLSTQYVAGL